MKKDLFIKFLSLTKEKLSSSVLKQMKEMFDEVKEAYETLTIENAELIPEQEAAMKRTFINKNCDDKRKKMLLLAALIDDGSFDPKRAAIDTLVLVSIFEKGKEQFIHPIVELTAFMNE